jgi:hypothetical protein
VDLADSQKAAQEHQEAEAIQQEQQLFLLKAVQQAELNKVNQAQAVAAQQQQEVMHTPYMIIHLLYIMVETAV